MTREERERMNWLCKQIQEERDPNRFGQLIIELNELLAEKESRITSPQNNAKFESDVRQSSAPAQPHSQSFIFPLKEPCPIHHHQQHGRRPLHGSGSTVLTLQSHRSPNIT